MQDSEGGCCSVQKPSSEGVLKDFAKFTEKHLCQILLFNKVAGFFKKTPLVATSIYSTYFEEFYLDGTM